MHLPITISELLLFVLGKVAIAVIVSVAIGVTVIAIADTYVIDDNS